jgi:hypothetical protein
MKPWTFKREAGWMLWIGLAGPIVLLLTMLIRWIRDAAGW